MSLTSAPSWEASNSAQVPSPAHLIGELKNILHTNCSFQSHVKVYLLIINISRCSKAALNMLTKCFSNEVQDLIFVAIHPGWVQTEMGSAKNRSPPLTVPESAKAIINTAEKIVKEDSGSFWSFEGHKLPY